MHRHASIIFSGFLIFAGFCLWQAHPSSPGELAPLNKPALRPSLVPLLWTQGQPPDTIRRVIREVADGGNTGFVWESRPHPDYLGPKWWSDLKVAVDEARRFGLEVWIFDEWMYPSGIAGGKVIAENPEFSHHILLDRSLIAEGPQAIKGWDIPGGLESSEKVVSITAFPDPTRKRIAPIDLSIHAQGSDGRHVRWAVPQGRWRICWAVSKPELPKEGWRMDTMIDVLNPKAVEAFIRLTHEATFKYFADDFGKTIKGFFSDETGFRNVTSYQSLPGKPGMPMPWSPAFADYFRKVKGYDPRPLLASLWFDLGEKGRAARFDLMDAYSNCFAETFFKPQQEWCRAHRVRLIGHVVEDNGADSQLGYGPGHWFRTMKYFDVPGIDIVGYQVTPGLDSGTNRWVPNSNSDWDEEFFQFGLPAMARGAALIKNSPNIFSEAFGANGWGEGLRMVKWIGDWHFASGINFLSPHAVTMKFNDPDCPPHFNRTSGNPQWRYYSVWAEYAKRLQSILLNSAPVFDAVVLYTAESEWVGPAQPAAPVVRALENKQILTAVLPYDIWEKEGEFKNGRWVYHGSSFSSVILSSVRYVPAKVMVRLADFAQKGGKVVILDRWPEGSIDGRSDREVLGNEVRLKKAAGTVLCALPEIGLSVSSLAGAVLSPRTPDLMMSRRKAEKGEWFLLHNRSLDTNVRGSLLIHGAQGTVLRFDAERGKYLHFSFSQTPQGIAANIDIPPYSLLCLWIGENLPAIAAPPVYAGKIDIHAEWRVAVVNEDGQEERAPVALIKGLSDWRRWPGFEKYAGTLRYRCSIDLPSLKPEEALELDAGAVGEIAELKINGRPAGVRIAPPYLWEITELVRPGQNIIEVDVTNTAQARWTDAFSRGDALSGLMGPVSILRGERKSK